MRLSLLLLGSTALALAGGAPADAGGLPVCNGKHKRPANFYGSVLTEGLKPGAPTDDAGSGGAIKPAGGGSGTPSPPPITGAKPAALSRAELTASFARCGAGGRT